MSELKFLGLVIGSWEDWDEADEQVIVLYKVKLNEKGMDILNETRDISMIYDIFELDFHAGIFRLNDELCDINYTALAKYKQE